SQLLATLGEFHDRIRDLESKLGDRESRPAAASYEQLLNAKEAELLDLRKLGPERDRLTGQLAIATSDLQQARQRIAALEQQFASREKDFSALQAHAAVVGDLEQARRRIVDLESHVSRQEADLRAIRTANAERDSLAGQLQTAATTIDTLKTRAATLEQHLKEREQAFETVRARLAERDKLIPQYNAMVAEVYQARHRITSLEQRAAGKVGEVPPTAGGASGESARAPTSGRETLDTKSSSLRRDIASSKPSASGGARQLPPGRSASATNDEGSRGPTPAISASVNARNESFATMKEELLKVLPGDRGQKTISVKQDGNRLTVALASNWLFTSGDAALTPEGLTMLRRVGMVLGQVPDRYVQVTGHTDNQAISKALQKTFPDNKALSWARAENARRALINGGMPADRTKAVGLADSRPLASNSTEQGRQKNRRLELIIVQSATVATAVEGTIPDPARFAALNSAR
ncbi:MAG TPA: OmpA family protein, partial [Nitrospira sp.]|nr:OmpA family protein [Nitrospira sp.]